MTDAHCHVTGGDAAVRELLVGRDFVGVHPWECLAQPTAVDGSRLLPGLRERLVADPRLGVGEIGLDRLKDRTISPQMRELFEAQLRLALEFGRPVVLHGAKCWGQVVETVRRLRSEVCGAIRQSEQSDNPSIRQSEQSEQSNNRTILSFLFHGFSRSDGLIPDIVSLNGYISVGPAVMNDHAVNYRELVKKIPLDRLLVETDRTPENAATCPSVREVAAKVAELRGLSSEELERTVDANADRFLRPAETGSRRADASKRELRR